MKHLLSLQTSYLKESILAPLFKLLEAFLALLVPMVIAGFVDQSLPQGDHSSLDADWPAPYLCSNWRFSGLDSSILFSASSSRGFAKILTRSLSSYSFLAKGQRKDRDNF